jgi:hypothetical protein
MNVRCARLGARQIKSFTVLARRTWCKASAKTIVKERFLNGFNVRRILHTKQNSHSASTGYLSNFKLRD